MLPPLPGLTAVTVDITIGGIARSVFVYLGVPFLAGLITRITLRRLKGDAAFAAVIGPLVEVTVLIALVGVSLRLRKTWFAGGAA